MFIGTTGLEVAVQSKYPAFVDYLFKNYGHLLFADVRIVIGNAKGIFENRSQQSL